MGLSISLSNALSGMMTTQKGLEILSGNVSNAGTPGYHRRSVNLIDMATNGSTYARLGAVNRAFSDTLQQQYSNELSKSGYSGVIADFLSRVDVLLGKPGSETSLDTAYANLESKLQAMAVSPDNHTVRSEVMAAADGLVTILNTLSSDIQDFRIETEHQISNHVTDLNRMLQSLAEINNKLTDQGNNAEARMGLLDERDRLVAGVAELIDVRVDYRGDGKVALISTAGLGLLDEGPTVFEFIGAGGLSPNSQFSADPAENGVGVLVARTPAGFNMDLVQQNILISGRIKGLIDLRDSTMVEFQDQLDEIAAGLAQSLSTVVTEGTPVTGGPPDGFDIDVANMQPGNEFSLTYTVGGTQQTVRVVRVEDTSKLPMDFVDPNGARVIGMSFAGGLGAVAAALDTAFGPAVTVTNPSGSTIRIVDDGVANTSNINSLTLRTTVTAAQGAGSALSLFVDSGNTAFTNSLDGDTQKLGFANRIKVNSAVLADNRLLVQAVPNASLGDDTRAKYLLDGLQDTIFTGTTRTSPDSGNFRMKGNVQDLVAQMMNHQGASVTAAQGNNHTAELSLEAVSMRMSSEYDVDVNTEMARLMELQNAYAASARVVSIVQSLLDELMNI